MNTSHSTTTLDDMLANEHNQPMYDAFDPIYGHWASTGTRTAAANCRQIQVSVQYLGDPNTYVVYVDIFELKLLVVVPPGRPVPLNVREHEQRIDRFCTLAVDDTWVATQGWRIFQTECTFVDASLMTKTPTAQQRAYVVDEITMAYLTGVIVRQPPLPMGEQRKMCSDIAPSL